MSRPSLLILLLLFSSALCAAEPAPDQRAPIRLKAQEKAQIHAEMRMFLSVTQKIVAGVAANDMMAVAAAAHEAGMASAGDMPDSVRVKLPLPFKQLGHATHMAFDDLARDAVGRVERDVLQEPLHHRVQPPRANVLLLPVELLGGRRERLDRVGRDLKVDALGRQEQLRLAHQGVLGLHEDAREVGAREALELHADRQAALRAVR